MLNLMPVVYLAPSFGFFGLIAGSLRLTSYIAHSAARFRGSCQLRWLGLGCVAFDYMLLISDVCSCHVLRILAVAVCRIGDICCLPAPMHQPFYSTSLDLSAPEEAYSRNVRASGTLKLVYEGFFKIG